MSGESAVGHARRASSTRLTTDDTEAFPVRAEPLTSRRHPGGPGGTAGYPKGSSTRRAGKPPLGPGATTTSGSSRSGIS
jgi:hypothetical protein